jgi:hypothetical protein
LSKDIEANDPIQDLGKGKETPATANPPSLGTSEKGVGIAGHKQPDAKPPSPRVKDLTAAANHQAKEDTTHSPTKEIPRPPLKPCSPCKQHPEFIKARCHLGAFVMATVNTEAEQADIQAIQCDLDLALTRINVSSAFILAYSF